MNIKKPVTALLATASLFSLGAAYANEPVWDGNKVELVAEKLGDGVFAYYPSDAKELQPVVVLLQVKKGCWLSTRC